MLAITYSPRFKTHFVACNAYPECKTTYSLPSGNIKKAGKVCESCGFPMLMRLAKGKKPWIFCFNKECESNKKRLEEYKRNKKNQSDFSSKKLIFLKKSRKI
jgi:DNA topoisomerase-1